MPLSTPLKPKARPVLGLASTEDGVSKLPSVEPTSMSSFSPDNSLFSLFHIDSNIRAKWSWLMVNKTCRIGVAILRPLIFVSFTRRRRKNANFLTKLPLVPRRAEEVENEYRLGHGRSDIGGSSSEEDVREQIVVLRHDAIGDEGYVDPKLGKHIEGAYEAKVRNRLALIKSNGTYPN